MGPVKWSLFFLSQGVQKYQTRIYSSYSYEFQIHCFHEIFAVYIATKYRHSTSERIRENMGKSNLSSSLDYFSL